MILRLQSWNMAQIAMLKLSHMPQWIKLKNSQWGVYMEKSVFSQCAVALYTFNAIMQHAVEYTVL